MKGFLLLGQLRGMDCQPSQLDSNQRTKGPGWNYFKNIWLNIILKSWKAPFKQLWKSWQPPFSPARDSVWIWSWIHRTFGQKSWLSKAQKDFVKAKVAIRCRSRHPCTGTSKRQAFVSMHWKWEADQEQCSSFLSGWCQFDVYQNSTTSWTRPTHTDEKRNQIQENGLLGTVKRFHCF